VALTPKRGKKPDPDEGLDPAMIEIARELGRLLAKRHLEAKKAAEKPPCTPTPHALHKARPSALKGRQGD